jgi:hypothetical protein
VEDARQYGIIPGLLDRRAKLDEEDFLETARLIEDVQERPGFVALLELLADAKRLYEGELYGRKTLPYPEMTRTVGVINGLMALQKAAESVRVKASEVTEHRELRAQMEQRERT